MLKSFNHHIRTQLPKPLTFFFSTSSNFPRNKYHNYYLRNRRKWPHPVYKLRWHQKLSQQHAMQSLRHQPSPNPLQSLIKSFNLYNCDPTPNSYRFVIKTLINTSQSHLIPEVLQHLKQFEKIETPESILIDLIEFYGDRKELQNAIDVFFKSPSFRCTPSVDALNCLLSVLCRHNHGLEVVPQLLVKCRLLNIRIEASTFAIFIKALCRFKHYENAVGLLRHMVGSEIDVDNRSVSLIVLTLCWEKSLECDEVMGLVEEMRRLGFCLDGADWGNVIRYLGKKGKGVEALEALRKMKLDGFKPDAGCYNAVLEGVVSIGDFESAERVFDEMLVMGLVLGVDAYNVYVCGLCKQKRFDEGIEMVLSMEEIGCKPNMITYDIVLSAMYESGEVGMASKFLKLVRGKGVVLNSNMIKECS